MILLIDNYDSFVYNLARYVGRLGRERAVVRNDAITLPEIRALNPEAVILSPGPRGPEEAGLCNDIIRDLHQAVPILGVCLGHQCIGAVFGAHVGRAPRPVHGKASVIHHDGSGLFMGLPAPLNAARYHSLIVSLPAEGPLRATAHDDNGLVMAMQHETSPVYGVQFHPESILTDYGLDILRNFLLAADLWHEQRRGAA